MKVEFELSKYDILGMASLMGAKQENIEAIEKYVDENDSLNIDCVKEGDEGYSELKAALSAFTVAQISVNLNLE